MVQVALLVSIAKVMCFEQTNWT